MASESRRTRRPTSTSNFGVGRRESHDASDFYARFAPPEISDDREVGGTQTADVIYCADARDPEQMDLIADASVALVVTSPPYFAGKEYEEELGAGHIPANYVEYLDMLHDVFAQCVRKLEPGGRICVNVANLGRKPYRSLSADVIAILQDRLRLLLRGEIVWQKGRAAGGSCAWGSFQSPSNPVLRDLTERVVVASKTRFDRALSRTERAGRGLPSDVTIFKDEFLEATTDVWEILPERATAVGHPAPFPVGLPQRLIELYTYRDDLVLDPFMGSGSTAVAAVRSNRRFVGFDTDPAYVDAAEARVEAERERLTVDGGGTRVQPRLTVESASASGGSSGRFQDDAIRQGLSAVEVAEAVLADCDFKVTSRRQRLKSGITIDVVAEDAHSTAWYFTVLGTLSVTDGGLASTDTLWRTLGEAAVIRATDPDVSSRLVLLATQLPSPRTHAGQALKKTRDDGLFADYLDMFDVGAQARLRDVAAG